MLLLLLLVLYLRSSVALLVSTENRISTRNITCKHDFAAITTFRTNCEACLITSRNYAIETALSLTGTGLRGLSYACLQVNEVEVYHENLFRECHYFPRDTLNGYDDLCTAAPYNFVRGSYRACICISNTCNFNYTLCTRQISPLWNQKAPVFSRTIVQLTDRVKCYQPPEDYREQTYSNLTSLCADNDEICQNYLFHQGVLCAISIDRTNKITRQTLTPSMYSAYIIKYKTQLCKSYTWTSKSISFSQCELEDTVCMCAFDQCNKDLETCRRNEGVCHYDCYSLVFLLVLIVNIYI